MTTPNPTEPPFALVPNAAVFDLDPAHPWPMPPVRPFVPAPRELTLKERWKINAMRRLAA